MTVNSTLRCINIVDRKALSANRRLSQMASNYRHRIDWLAFSYIHRTFISVCSVCCGIRLFFMQFAQKDIMPSVYCIHSWEGWKCISLIVGDLTWWLMLIRTHGTYVRCFFITVVLAPTSLQRPHCHQGENSRGEGLGCSIWSSSKFFSPWKAAAVKGFLPSPSSLPTVYIITKPFHLTLTL